jgi:hypothetical protein
MPRKNKIEDLMHFVSFVAASVCEIFGGFVRLYYIFWIEMPVYILYVGYSISRPHINDDDDDNATTMMMDCGQRSTCIT